MAGGASVSGMRQVFVLALLALAALLAGCAASPAAPPASEYTWNPPRPGDTREAHVYGVQAPTSQPAVATSPPGRWTEPQSGQSASVAPGEPWVESSDSRWSTHRIAAPQPVYEDAPPAVITYAPAPAPVVYVNPYPSWGYSPAYYGAPYYSRPFVGVGIGFGGGFGGGWGGFHGGSRGWGGSHGGGGFHGGRR
jgi:hypothetical protein